MATLKSEHKTFIVAAIARYKTPSEVAALVKDEFGLDISRQQVRAYNPLQNDECSEKWRELFEQERKNFLEDRSRIGIANTNYRMQVYQDLLQNELAKPRPNGVLILDIMKQAASDEGGLYAAKADKGALPPSAPPNVLAAIMKVYGPKNPDNADGSG